MWCVAPFLLLECNYSMEQISLSYINLLSLERETINFSASEFHESLQCSPRTWSAFENKQNYFTEIIVNYLLLSFCFYFCCRNMDLCLLFLGSLFISVYGKISGVKNLLRHNICINSSWWAFWVLGEPTDKFFFHSPEKCIGLLLLWKDFFFPFSFLSHISALVLPVFSNGEWLKLMLF